MKEGYEILSDAFPKNNAMPLILRIHAAIHIQTDTRELGCKKKKPEDILVFQVT